MILSKLGYLHADLAINRGFNRNHHLSNLLSLQVGGGTGRDHWNSCRYSY